MEVVVRDGRRLRCHAEMTGERPYETSLYCSSAHGRLRCAERDCGNTNLVHCWGILLFDAFCGSVSVLWLLFVGVRSFCLMDVCTMSGITNIDG